MAGGFRSFLALLRKNGLQTIRSPGYLIGEIIVFAILFGLTLLILVAKNQMKEMAGGGGEGEVKKELMNNESVFYYTSQRPISQYSDLELERKIPRVMLAKGSKVKENDFNFFVAQLKKSMNVTTTENSEKLLKSLLEDAQSDKFPKISTGIYIENLDNAKGNFSYRMYIKDDKFFTEGLNLWQGWQRAHAELFESSVFSLGLDWCQSMVDSALYEGTKKHKGVIVSHEVKLASYKLELLDPKAAMVAEIIEFKNLIVMTMIIFTVRSIMHDNEHMKDFISVMGVTDTVFYLSHVTFLFLKQFILVLPIVLVSASIFNLNLGMVFLSNFVEFFVIIAFTLLMSSLFKSPAVTTLATVVTFLGLFVWACKSEVCLPSEGTCMAGNLNPFLAKQNVIGIVASVTATHNSYSFGDMFQWRSFHYPAIVPLTFMLLDMTLMLIVFILFSKWGNISCKRKHTNTDDDEKRPMFSNAEEKTELGNAVVDIEIKDVTKVYKTGYRAVHGLNLEAVKGQVTVLLGHNGAGKTTTFTMICGTEKPTEGTLNICGHPAGSAEAKKNIGYCSQKNTLLDSLTVQDHLRLAYSLKCASSDFKAELDELLKLVGLTEYKSKKTKTLSGGQKRKLCLCMALIGKSSVVLLDEPTAGMDVESRQEVETFLDTQKGNRTFLLTTHYMDEAECLGDRVFIMSGGRVVCSGTSDFLKKRFASGYTLTVLAQRKQENMHPLAKKLEKHLKNHVKDAKLAEIRGVQMDFELTADSKDKFAALFEDLEQNKEKLEIANFGLSMGNLEQVFLKVGHATNEVEDKDKKEERVRGLLTQVYEDDSVQGCSLRMAQFSALFKKKVRYSIIKWPITIFLQLLAPILILTLCMISAKVDFSGDAAYDVNLKDFGSGQFLTQDLLIPSQSQFKPHFDKFTKEELKTNKELRLEVIKGEEAKDMDNYAKDEIDDPLPAMGIMYGLECNEKKCTAVNKPAATRAILATTQAMPNGSTDGTTADMSTTAGLASTVAATFSGASTDVTVSMPLNATTVGISQVPVHQFNSSELLRYNKRHLYCLPTALNLFGTANLRTIVPDGRITVNVQFFSPNMKSSSNFVVLLTMLMALVFAALTEPLAEDVTSGFMYQQLLAGVPVWLYWTVEYLYAFLLYSFQCAFYLATLCLTDELSAGSGMRAVLIAIVFFYSVWPVVCWLSNSCKAASTATVTIAMWLTLGILAGILLVVFLTVGLLYLNPGGDHAYNMRVITCIASAICPGFPLKEGLEQLQKIEILQSKNVDSETLEYEIADFNLYVVIMAVMGTVHTLLFVLSRVKAVRRGCSSKGKRDLIPPAVKQEEQNLTDEIVLEVNDLSKMFKKKCALAHVSFKVQKQECFGLLGVSGAGKTTAFNIITGQMIPSEGGVTLDGVDIKTNIIVGLCPQFDTLQPSFKGKHSLAILAKVHGYRDVNGVVEKLIEMVDMEEHAGKGFNTCSGGQKRRLSVAAALLPRKSPFVILDEATAGIDPVARRDVWSVLSVVREHSAILMSSHSMEECDALCNRISILRDGQIAATGSSQEPKSRLGNFYVLSLSLSAEQHKDNAQRTVGQHFPGSTLQKGSFSRNMKWKLPRRKGDLWSNVFERCQTIASKIGASDFCVTQPSLQDIFLIIATHSENEAKGDDNAVPTETSTVASKNPPTGKTASAEPSDPQSSGAKDKGLQETQPSNASGKK